ncbi:MAG: GMC oxidoreductase [Porticoccaceae bacterium]|nr:GMC oxidoreductase [Porticoccaceae bacterium]
MGFLFPEEPGKPREITTEDGVRRREIGCGEGGFLGSPDGGKTSLEVAYLYKAMQQGLEICDQQEVLAIRKETKAGETRYCVNVENHHTGQFESHYAKHVIVAAGTVNTLHLLLHSRDGEKGLGGMPQLGKNFGSNGDYFAYWDWQDRFHDMSQSLPINGYVRLKGKANQPFIIEAPLPCPDKLRLPSWIAKKLRQGTFIAGMGKDAMDGTVSLKKGKLNVDYKPENSSIFDEIRGQMDHIAEKTGKGILSIKRPTTAHPLGGACIGRNTDEVVVDGKGEVFDHPGLYVADAAALPKPVEGPPSMTVAAWANHVGEQLIMKLGRENADSFGQPFLLQELSEKQLVERDERG